MLKDAVRKVWTEAEAARLERNCQVCDLYKRAMETYDTEKTRCKQLRIACTLQKPTLVIEKPLPKSWLADKEVEINVEEPVSGPSASNGGSVAAVEEDEDEEISGDEDDQLSD
jgi:hypothetical protein